MCLLTYKNKEMKCNFIRPCAAMLRAYVIMELVPFLFVSFKKNKRKRWRDRLCIDTRAKETGGQCVDGRTCGVSCEQNSEKPFNPCVCRLTGIAHASHCWWWNSFSPSVTENGRKKTRSARSSSSIRSCFFVCQSMTTHAITSKITEKPKFKTK